MYTYLSAMFVGLLIISNVLAVKLVSIWGFILPGAVIVYVVTYLITDVIGELYGKEAARKTVQAGFITQIAALIFIFIAIQLPPAPVFESQAQFEEILGGSFRVILASLISYFASQNLDVTIFHRLKAKHGESKLWLRNNLSTMTSQLVDTAIFITIAFWGTVPGGVLFGMIATQYVFKFLIALIDTPIAYILVYFGRKRETEAAV
ncbi:queuosine precursor transporter [Virgibacillus sp. YIM 98842]|uniref:queuosine precursor transporter n=1 Tax=Virgibacillus sp. YIM 98842 TaxID=2663533 RepID=UPI0013DB5710|nr:queuosine precursor transporter [Virgibacillus sp. YIM 98842]